MSPHDRGMLLQEAMIAELPRAMRATLAPDTALSEIIGVMAQIVSERAALIDRAADLFDPATAPAEFLPWLCGWYGFEWLFTDPSDPRLLLPMARAFPTGEDRLRALLVAWPRLTERRGSADGLRMTLELATGLQTIAVRQFPDRQHLRVHAPGLCPAHLPWLQRLIAAERPAHMTWAVTLSPEQQA